MGLFGKRKKLPSPEEVVIQGLLSLVEDRIEKNWNHMGVRVETEDLTEEERSKAVRAYIVDLLGGDYNLKGLGELEEAIGKSISLYYDQLR